jgi:arabinogalactan oligomer/maltooligosaccharide transport system substrate-binding protein
MKKNLKIVSLLALGVVSVAGLASCGPKGPTYTEYSGTLAISGPAEQAEWLTARLEAYNALRVEAGVSAITFEVRSISESNVDSEVADWSTGPDVYAYASDKVANLYQKGALAEVRGEYKDFIKDTMSTAALEAATFAGKTLAYPYAGDNGYFLMYDSTKLSAEDVVSFDALFAKAAELELKVAYPLETSFFSAGALFTYGARFNATYTETGTLEEVTADFNTTKGLKAGKAIYNIVKNASWTNTEAAPTAANKVAAVVTGSWNVSAYQAQVEAAGGTFACAPIPTMTVDGDTKNMGSFLGYKLYGVNPQASAGNSDRLAAAHEVAMYLAGEDVQKARFDTFKVAPTNKTILALSEVQNTPHIKAIAAQAQYSVAQTAVPAGVWSAPGVFVQAIESGKCTLENMTSYLETLNNTIVGSEG